MFTQNNQIVEVCFAVSLITTHDLIDLVVKPRTEQQDSLPTCWIAFQQTFSTCFRNLPYLTSLVSTS